MTQKEKIMIWTGSFVLIVLLCWFSIMVIVPQKQRLQREQNMSMWNAKGRQMLSRMGYCEEVSIPTNNKKIAGYAKEQSNQDKSVTQKSCEAAKKQAFDVLQWCSIDIPQQLEHEGKEIHNKRYLEQKDFILDLCDVLLQSGFGQNK
jgi:hypothetical protein